MERKITIGIFIPIADIGPFFSEGIMRLLGFLIPHWLEKGTITIKIACASWIKPELINFLISLGIDINKISFITTKHQNFLVSLYKNNLLKQSQKSNSKINNETYEVSSRSIKFQQFIKECSSIIFYRWWLFIIFLPILTIFGIIFYFGYLFYIFANIFFTLTEKILSKVNKYLLRPNENYSTKSKIKNLIIKFALKIKSFSLNAFFRRVEQKIFGLIKYQELEHVYKKMIKDKTVDCWFFPIPRGKYIERLKKPVIVAVPDIVHYDFATRFISVDHTLLNLINEIQSSLQKSAAIITYSNYVKENHIIRNGFYSDEKIHVIPHAPINLKPQLTNDPSISDEVLKQESINVINEYISGLSKTLSKRQFDYISNIQFKDIKYLFVSSQTRPHKNHLNLLKSYEGLLRRKYQNVKLILTGAIDEEMSEYINEKNLHLDVLSFRDLPSKVHSAFYACAELTIAPTLFEGSFPFVFSESLSVGTPVLLSNIPAVIEFLPLSDYSKFVFDPYNIQDIVEKTNWALSNRDEIKRIEMEFLLQMNKRSWCTVAKEYYDVFLTTFNK